MTETKTTETKTPANFFIIQLSPRKWAIMRKSGVQVTNGAIELEMIATATNWADAHRYIRELCKLPSSTPYIGEITKL